ncbi:CheW-like domain protein [compost metagenome]
MSDFFGDDFTAELKGYFIDSLMKEAEKYIDLVDDTTWKRLIGELDEQAQSWSVDAKTNEFEHFAQWLTQFQEKIPGFQRPADLSSALATLKAYLEALNVDKKDSPEFFQKFSVEATITGRSQFLHCRMGDISFVISVNYVMEVVDKLPVYSLPDPKSGLSGVIPFRGEAIPVVSLTDYGFKNVAEERLYFVICEWEGTRLALQVTEADQLLTLENAELQPVTQDSFMISVPFITNFFIRENKSVMVLDLEKMVA